MSRLYVKAFTGARLTTSQSSMQQYLKQLLNWRKNNPVIANGKTLHFAPDDSVYVCIRYGELNLVMVVMNKNVANIILNTTYLQEMLFGKTTATNVISHERSALNKP